METKYRIADVARRTGFNTSALRYYEDIGLLPAPDRTDAGYRVYDERAVTRLRFIAHAKQLGCSLEEITDLVHAWERDRCAPVAEQLRALVATKLTATADRISELTTFSRELEQTATALSDNPTEGPCDDDCTCMTTTPIACTLDTSDMPQRLEDWQHVLSFVTAREPIANGLRLTFGPDVDIVELARLAAAEQGCCQFFAFALTVDGRGIGLEVCAPDEAQSIVTSLFGATGAGHAASVEP